MSTYNLTLRIDRLDWEPESDPGATPVTVAAVASLSSTDPAVVAATLRAVADQLDPKPAYVFRGEPAGPVTRGSRDHGPSPTGATSPPGR